MKLILTLPPVEAANPRRSRSEPEKGLLVLPVKDDEILPGDDEKLAVVVEETILGADMTEEFKDDPRSEVRVFSDDFCFNLRFGRR